MIYFHQMKISGWVILAILLLSTLLEVHSQQLANKITIESVTGPATSLYTTNKIYSVSAGEVIPLGAILETHETSRAVLNPAPGITLKLEPKTRVTFVYSNYKISETGPEGIELGVELAQGSLEIKTADSVHSSTRIVVTTPQLAYVLSPGHYRLAHGLTRPPLANLFVGAVGVALGKARVLTPKGKPVQVDEEEYAIFYDAAQNFSLVGPEKGGFPSDVTLLLPGQHQVKPGETRSIEGKLTSLLEKSPVNISLTESTSDAVKFTLSIVIGNDYQRQEARE
jgi:hypothetical protein